MNNSKEFNILRQKNPKFQIPNLKSDPYLRRPFTKPAGVVPEG
jgi:hypothetical protein